MICPFCKEEIAEGAIKCKHCGSSLKETSPIGDPSQRSPNLKPQKKSISTIILIGALVLVACLVAGYFLLNNTDSYVSMVKNGSLQMAPNQKIGKAFNNFFGSPKWRHFQSNEGKNVVEFTGNFSYENEEAKALIQFKVEDDSFDVACMEVNEEKQNLLFFAALMGKVFGEGESEEADNEAVSNGVILKGKFKATMGDMKSLGSAIESYITDWAFAPQVESIEELNASWFVPFYIKVLPTEDAWGNSFLYKHGIPVEGSGDDYKGDIYAIASAGSDGRFEGFDQEGEYVDWENEDIIYSNGIFTYIPKIER